MKVVSAKGSWSFILPHGTAIAGDMLLVLQVLLASSAQSRPFATQKKSKKKRKKVLVRKRRGRCFLEHVMFQTKTNRGKRL